MKNKFVSNKPIRNWYKPKHAYEARRSILKCDVLWAKLQKVETTSKKDLNVHPPTVCAHSISGRYFSDHHVAWGDSETKYGVEKADNRKMDIPKSAICDIDYRLCPGNYNHQYYYSCCCIYFLLLKRTRTIYGKEQNSDEAKHHRDIFKPLNFLFKENQSEDASPERTRLTYDRVKWKRNQHETQSKHEIVCLTYNGSEVDPVSLVVWEVFERVFVDVSQE